MEPALIFVAVLVGVAVLSAMGYFLYPVFFPKVCQLSDSQKEIYELTSEEDSTDYAFRCKTGFSGNPTDISFECSDDKDDTYFTSISGCEPDCTLSDQQSEKYEMQDDEISCKDGYVQEGDEITPSCANGSYTFPAGFGCVNEDGGGAVECKIGDYSFSGAPKGTFVSYTNPNNMHIAQEISSPGIWDATQFDGAGGWLFVADKGHFGWGMARVPESSRSDPNANIVTLDNGAPGILLAGGSAAPLDELFGRNTDGGPMNRDPTTDPLFSPDENAADIIRSVASTWPGGYHYYMVNLDWDGYIPEQSGDDGCDWYRAQEE